MKSVYIHIPFCQTICSYCDFCKLYYQKKWAKLYLDALKKEIKSTYRGEKIRTIYIGGGTPSVLSMDDLSFLFEIINLFDTSSIEELTIECNIENTNEDKLLLFKKNNVNRISIGIQTFNKEHLSFLERNHSIDDVFSIIDTAKKIGFENINVDLIYGIPKQTLEEVKRDLELFIKLDVEHISTYSLILEENTKLYITKSLPLDEDLNNDMYVYINNELEHYGYNHYEISNYAKAGATSLHNLVYWDNEEYYGFGLGASSFICQKRYENTRSLTNYLKGDYILDSHDLSKREMMENEMILGLRKAKGVNIEMFFKKYQIDVNNVFDIERLIQRGDLVKKDNHLFIPKEKLFISNEILINFIS